MRKLCKIILVYLLFFCSANAAHATAITILDDYGDTADIVDVVHIGDQNYSYLIHNEPIGLFWSTSFILEEKEPIEGEPFTVTIDHSYANPSRGYMNLLMLNGYEIGYLSNDSTSPWLTESFQLSNSEILNVGSENIFTIYSGLSSSPGEDPTNYDDFEFTNIALEYNSNPVPEPATIWLLFSGIVGFIGFRKKVKKA